MTQELSDERRVERVMAEIEQGEDQPAESDPHPDRTRLFSHTGFSRMRTAWNPEEQSIIDFARSRAETEVTQVFADVYRILGAMYDIVREAEVDSSTGEVINDSLGLPVWRTDQYGSVIEDWSRLTEKEKENFLYQISTRLVMWEQRAADLWMEAMLAKGSWEERFARSFTTTPHIEGRRPTVEDRTQNAQGSSWDERYMALYMSARSRKAEALVRSMERLCRTLRDTSR